jgi:hypothetical protein
MDAGGVVIAVVVAVMLLAGLAMVCSFVAALVVHRRRTSTARNEMLRAGVSEDLDPEEAARRGGGLNAWMRHGGF